jgi:hypothetical protein
MGKDSKDHPLGDRGSTGGPGFAESGARNWVHSAATVLAFLQKERGLLQPGYKFRPMYREETAASGDSKAPRAARVTVPVTATAASIEISGATPQAAR